METKIYNQKGIETKTLKLPESIFGLPWNADLVHQVLQSMRSNMRQGTADTKGRGDVRGGGKKPWKQKGTGRARHGSIRSPLWRGGGTTHGPLAEKNYDRKINKKMKAKALFTLLSDKLRVGEILFVDTLALSSMKTKDAEAIVKALATVKGFESIGSRKKRGAHILIPGTDKNVEKSFANIPTVSLNTLSTLSPLDVAKYRYLIITDPAASITMLEAKLA